MRNLSKYEHLNSPNDFFAEIRSELNNQEPNDLDIIVDICNAAILSLGTPIFTSRILPYVSGHSFGYLNRLAQSDVRKSSLYTFGNNEPLFNVWAGFLCYLEKLSVNASSFIGIDSVVANFGGPSNLRSFDLTGDLNQNTLDPDDLSSFLSNTFFTDLEYLAIGHLSLDDDFLEQLCGIGLSNLVGLDLSGNRITGDGVQFIEEAVDSGLMPNLSSLTLQECSLNGSDVEAMSNSKIFHNFRYIDVTENSEVDVRVYCDACMISGEDSPFFNSIYQTYVDDIMNQWG